MLCTIQLLRLRVHFTNTCWDIEICGKKSAEVVICAHFCTSDSIEVNVTQSVSDAEGIKGPPTHDRLNKRCESCCRRWQWLNLSCIHHQRRQCSVPSSAGTPAPLINRLTATVSLECQTGQAYWRSGPGRITVQKQKHKWARECTKIRISRPKNEKIIPDLLTMGTGTPGPPYT